MTGKERPGPECAIARIIDKLDDDAREVIALTLPDRNDYPDKLMLEVLHEYIAESEMDVDPPSAYTLRWHRRGDCRCGSADVAS